MGYVITNSIADLQIIMQSLPLDYHVLSKTKLDEYGIDEIEIKMVMVLLRLWEEGLFMIELVTSN